MPRELVLLRHAHAEPAAPGQADVERPLSARGRAEAAAVGTWIARHALTFDAVLCSPAARTRQTLALALPGISAHYDARIYEAEPGTLIDVLEAAAGAQRVLLVGHNPGLEQLLALLTDGRSDAARGLPTAALARLQVPDAQPLEPGIARWRAYWSP